MGEADYHNNTIDVSDLELQHKTGKNNGKSAVVVWKSLSYKIPEGKFIRQPLRTFHCFSDFYIKIVKNMRPRVALGLTLNIFQ